MAFTLSDVQDEVSLLPPSDYKVVLYNDDYTTKDFVIYVLRTVFHKTVTEAIQTMELVHKRGRGVAGVYSYDIAMTRRQMTINLARSEGFPLRCELEEN